MHCGGQTAFPNPASASVVVPSSFVSHLPLVIAQVAPHSSFQRIEGMLPWFSGMGCDAIHISPVHPPSQVMVDGKVGSLYSIQDHMRVAPYLYDEGLDPRRWLVGDYVDRYQDSEAGWAALKGLTDRARSHGLKVIGDLVFGHTARDPESIRHHVSRFGPDFYKRREDGSIAYEGAEIDGRWDDWKDTAAIDYSNPRAVQYMTDVVNRHIAAGVSVFRADSAGKISTDVWEQIITGARRFAEEGGHETPRFYAEVFDRQAEFLDAGFDGVISLYRWGILKETHHENGEYVRRAGGAGVLYADNHDVRRIASELGGARQDIYTRLALLSFLTSSFMFLEGTTHFETVQPSVFLDRVGDAVRTFEDPDKADPGMVGLMKTLATIKREHPVFHTLAHTRFETEGTGLVQIRRTVPFEGGKGEQALIVWNPTGHSVTFNIPVEFQSGGHVFWTNWGQFGHPDERLRTVNYNVPAGGASLFIRGFDNMDSLGFRIPGYN